MSWRLGLLLVTLTACHEKGTVTVVIDDSMAMACVAQAEEVMVYAVAGRQCDGCDCSGACFGGDLVACNGEPCLVDDESTLLPFALPAGPSALIYDFYVRGSDQTLVHVATACADLDLDRDGTSSFTVEAPAMCCP